jgi:hypothetical protein
MVSIKPNSQLIEYEPAFIAEVPDSDRFKDISYIIYQQNSKLYQKLIKNQLNNENVGIKNDKNNKSPTETFKAQTYVNKSNPQSSVCSII